MNLSTYASRIARLSSGLLLAIVGGAGLYSLPALAQEQAKPNATAPSPAKPAAQANSVKTNPAKANAATAKANAATAKANAAKAIAAKANAAKAKSTAQGLEFFERRIRPVLVQKCYSCHSAESKEIKGSFVLDTREGLRQGGPSGHAVVPGSPQDSLILDALRYDSLQMPPDEQLSDEIIADFERWVRMGAPDPREGPAKVVKIAPKNPQEVWSLQPPVASPAPAVKQADWAWTDVDRFILAKLEAEGLRPTADADSAVWLRRVSFTLTGLPPTPTELVDFLNDSTKTAREKVVDRLLASPQFGERWGRHWLDVARFAESNGRERDVLFPHAWRYRDYVIQSFNEDKRYNRFILEQVAGDLLPASNGQDHDALIVATGLLAIGPKPLQQKGERLQMDMVDEQIDTLSRAVLGLTVSCARCHDHKFDPIPTRDYYALAGIFRSTETLYGEGINRANGKGKDVTKLLHPLGEHTINQAEVAAHRAQVAELEAGLTKARNVLKNREKQLAELEAEEKGSKKGGKNESPKKESKKDGAKNAPAKNAKETKDAPERDLKTQRNLIAKSEQDVARLEKELTELRKKAPAATEYAMAVREQKKVEDSKIYLRGEVGKYGDLVPRGYLSAINIAGANPVNREQSGRLQLAQWLINPANPLTARVAVNRIWQHVFGEGLVRSVDNFGANGDLPSHPELLDTLAVQFIKQGWSTKKLIRELVLSRVYQLSTRADEQTWDLDPENRWLARTTPQRLDAESLRDAILSVSGKLDLNQPDGSLVSKIGDGEVGRNANLGPLTSPFWHRSVYLPIIRSEVPEMLKVFDFAEPSIVVGRRNVTTVPSQALFLMNSPFVLAQAEALAERVAKQSGSDSQGSNGPQGSSDQAARVRFAYQLCFGRSPSVAELAEAQSYLDQVRSAPATGSTTQTRDQLAWTSFCQALLASAEFRYLN